MSAADKMFCYTPNITVRNTTRSKATAAGKTPIKSSDSETDNVELKLAILGFVLDGDSNYNNISKHENLPSKLDVYDPPVLESLKSTLQYKRNVPLEIKVGVISISANFLT